MKVLHKTVQVSNMTLVGNEIQGLKVIYIYIYIYIYNL